MAWGAMAPMAASRFNSRHKERETNPTYRLQLPVRMRARGSAGEHAPAPGRPSTLPANVLTRRQQADALEPAAFKVYG